MTYTSPYQGPYGDPGHHCVVCGNYYYGSLHTCPGPGNTVPTTWIYPNRPNTLPISPQEPLGARGWICPACGAGNAPWRAQCGCEGRTGTTTTTNTITVTPTISPICPDPSAHEAQEEEPTPPTEVQRCKVVESDCSYDRWTCGTALVDGKCPHHG